MDREIVNQPERILYVAARKIGLIFDDPATVRHRSALGFLDVADRHFQNWPERRPAFDKQVDVFAMQPIGNNLGYVPTTAPAVLLGLPSALGDE